MAQNPGYSPTKYFYLKCVLSLIISNKSVVFFIRALPIKEKKMERSLLPFVHIIDSEEVTNTEKYILLEQHFRGSFCDEIGFLIEKAQQEESVKDKKEFIEGMAILQTALIARGLLANEMLSKYKKEKQNDK